MGKRKKSILTERSKKLIEKGRKKFDELRSGGKITIGGKVPKIKEIRLTNEKKPKLRKRKK